MRLRPARSAPSEEAARWEPGAPSLRAFAPGAIGGGAIPLGVYYAVRPHVGTDAHALMIAGAPAALWVVLQWIRHRRLDPIGTIVFVGLVVGIAASLLLGGSAFVLKVRDSGFTIAFGLVCLASLWFHRPLMFFIGRAMSAGDDPAKLAAYDELWTMPTAPRTFRILTVVWGVGLILEASTRVIIAMLLPTGAFLAASPVLAAVVFGSLFAFTAWYSRRARRLAEELYAETGVIFPSV